MTMQKFQLSRRKFLSAAGIGASGLALSGCDVFDGLARDSALRGFMEGANGLTYRVQRLITGRDALAQEFTEADIRQPQRPNGVTAPDDDFYRGLLRNDFADWRLEVTGLVEKPLSLSRDQLLAMPSRTQITRHDCVEGWSCIAKWTGVPLSLVLDEAKVKPQARYAVFHCLDSIERGLAGDIKYYGSDDPRLRSQRQAAARRERRAAAGSCRAAARLQDAEISAPDRAGRQFRRDRPRQGRLLGG
jgi:DMSO/TMAO reductase YedYZ molybdopterin-dependent catalytic subunit